MRASARSPIACTERDPRTAARYVEQFPACAKRAADTASFASPNALTRRRTAVWVPWVSAPSCSALHASGSTPVPSHASFRTRRLIGLPASATDTPPRPPCPSSAASSAECAYVG